MEIEIVGNSGGGGSSNASVGTTGNTAPTSATEVGYVDSGGLLQPVSPSTPLPVTIDGGLANPLNVNVADIAGNATAVGTGASSSGTQRVVLASDSPLAPGAATAALQTTGNTLLGIISTDLIGGSQLTAISNQGGTAIVAVKPASTAAAATDPALVVSLSPNSPVTIIDPANLAPATQNITVVDSGSTTTAQANGQNAITGTPTANSAASFSVASYQSVEVQVTGTWTGTLSSEVSFDSGVTWFTRGLKQTASSYLASTFTANFQGGANATGITNYRVRATAAVTGTAVVKAIFSMSEASVVVSNPQTLRDGTTQSIVNTIKAPSTAPLATDTALVTVLSPNQPVIPAYIANSAGAANAVRPDAEIRVATDTISSFYDTFDSGTLDVTNRWNATGTTPTAASGVLTVSAGTTALAFSALQSQPAFPLYGNMYSYAATAMTVDSSLKTGALRFFGVGTAQASPTVAAPIVNGAGFFWDATTGVLSGQVWSAGSMTQTVSLSASQPTDGAQHRYGVYFKTTRVYFEIDNVSVGTLANPSTAVSTLPVLNLVVNGASTVSPAAVFTSSFVGIGDTAGNGRMISDGAFPWRKATVSSSGGLSVSVTPDQSQGVLITGSAIGTNVNNLLTGGATSTSTLAFKSGYFQLIGAGGMNGQVFFEQSWDNSNFIQCYMSSLNAIGIALNNGGYNSLIGSSYYGCSIQAPFFRIRTNTLTVGTVQAIGYFSQAQYQASAYPVTQGAGALPISGSVTATVSQATASSLNATVVQPTASSLNAVVTPVSGANMAVTTPAAVIDVPSATLATTTTTAAFTPTYGCTYEVNLVVTAVAGAGTITVAIQESEDSGTNWVTVLTLPTASAIGAYFSGPLTLRGNRVRYVQTITGTSVTRAIDRLQSSSSGFSQALPGVLTDNSGTTSGTPNTSTTLMAANPGRKYLLIQNLGATGIYVNFTSAASTTNSIFLAPLSSTNGAGSILQESSFVSTEAINVISSGTSVAYVAKQA